MPKTSTWLNQGKDGVLRLNVSVHPDRVEDVVEALDTIKRLHYDKSKSHAVCEALVSYAKTIIAHADTGE